MGMVIKHIEDLQVTDFIQYPVWEYVHSAEEVHGERAVKPVAALPVDSLVNRLVGTEVVLRNGTRSWAVLSNISLDNLKRTEHFLTLWLEHEEEWFELARYFDADYAQRGPVQLAEFLGLSCDQVFPISYDIRSLTHGLLEVRAGTILIEPRKRLSRVEIIGLAVS